jgi:serine/threonine-protein kinase
MREWMVSEESRAFQVPERFGVGSRVAGYMIEEQIGQGGMAVVFRAHDDRLDRTVALKILAPALAADEAFRQRFIRESRAAAAVDDPHIIPVFEAGEASGVLFIAMRFVRGGDVRALIAQGDLPPAGRVAGIVAQAASALDAAHDRGLVHRDVKPANMLLDSRGSGQDRSDHVYLSDFGLSKWAVQTTGLTDTGTFLGTLDYIAPEQIEGRPVDGQADQYSLACAAFELLSGSPPFRGKEAMAVMHAQLSQPPPLVSERRTDIPPAVNQVFARAMAKAAGNRYPTCREFAVALREALGLGAAGVAGRQATEAVIMSADTQAATPRQPVSFQQPAAPVQPALPVQPGVGRSRPRVNPLLLVGASLVLAAGIVAAAIIVRSPGSTPAGSQPGTAGQVKPSVSPAGHGHAGGTSSGNGTGSGDGQASQTANRQAGFRLGSVLNPGVGGSVTSVAWRPGGTLVATSDKNGSTYVWDVTSGRQAVPPFAGPGKAFAAAFSPDGTELATGYSNGTTYLWDYKTGQLLARLRDPGAANGKEVDSVAFSPDGGTLVTGDGNGYANVWKVPGGARTARLAASLADPVGAGVFSVAFSGRGTLATGDYDGHVYIWDVASGTTTATFALAGGNCPTTICAAVSALAFSGDGRVLAAGNESGAAELWSLSARAGRPIDPPAAAAGQSIWAFAFSGSALLAMGDADGHAYLYRLAGDGTAASIAGALTNPNSGSEGVGALAFSADGRYLVTGDTNGNAYLWRAR